MPAVAYEQRLTELGLQLPDLLGQRGLADVQPGGRAAEVQLVGDRDEVAHEAQVEIHAVTPAGRSTAVRRPVSTVVIAGRTSLGTPLVIDPGANRYWTVEVTRVLPRYALGAACPHSSREVLLMPSTPTPSSSSTACGCTPPAGAPGSTCSSRPATSRPLLAGRTSRERWRRRGRTPTPWPASASTRRTEHFASIIEQLGAPPVLVGHSFGGLLAEKLLGRGTRGRCGRHRPGPDQGSAAAAPVAAAGRPPGAGQPGQPSAVPSLLTSKEFRFGFGNAVTPRRSPTSCSSPGRSRRPRGRCSRRQRPTSACTPRPPSRPATRTAGRCC